MGQVDRAPLLRVSAQGGKAPEAARLQAPAERSHPFASVLPDGRHFLCYVTRTPNVRGVDARRCRPSRSW
jgi:hypothetical protein